MPNIGPHYRMKLAVAGARRCATLEGFSLHANTPVHESDRLGLETLCRYGARGALSLERLSRREDGTLAYRMKRPAPDGSTQELNHRTRVGRRCRATVRASEGIRSRALGIVRGPER